MYTGKFFARDETQIHTRSWILKDSIADIILIHGFLEHSGRYSEEANFFMDHRLSVLSYDHRAHGLSGGKQGYIKDFNLLVNDLEDFMAQARVNPSKPYFFFAHSMGGLVLTSHLLEKFTQDPQLKGVILSAPFLSPDPDLAPFLIKISGFLSRFLPYLRTVGANPEYISSDPQTVKAYVEDPLVDNHKAYARTAHQILCKMKQLEPRFEDFNIPFLLMHGTEDKLSAIEGSERLFSQAKTDDKSFYKLDGLRHEITREINRQKVFNLMSHWLKSKLNS